MTPEAQRIAIAEACGWKQITHEDKNRFWYLNGEITYEQPPFYCGDLNAMHDAERLLVADCHDRFRDALKAICLDWWMDKKHYTPFPECATAAQRSEAFLRTINKWSDQ